jgi:cytochrome c biogenesis protein CcmG, thiol:disulfide interchange protein DsbE
VLGSVALLGALLFAAGCNRGDHPQQIGTPAPAFSIADGTRTVALNDYRGKILVLNFWATWCAPCIEEIPSLDQLQRAMPQIAVLGVSTDEDAAAYRQFLLDHPVNFATIRDGSQHSNDLFGTLRFPETYIIDRHGMIRRKFIGPQDWTTPEILQYLAHL